MPIKTAMIRIVIACMSLIPFLANASSQNEDITIGSALYKQACYSCHDSGLVKAPKLGDKRAWAPIKTQEIKTLTQSVIKGKTAMPPRGGTQFTDAQIEKIILFMISKIK